MQCVAHLYKAPKALLVSVVLHWRLLHSLGPESLNVPGHLLSTGHLLSRGFPDAKDGRRRLFSQQTNISAVHIPRYRSFDAVDLAVARICIGTLVLSLATLKCLLSHSRRLLCTVF
jgi:hypothetical protein